MKKLCFFAFVFVFLLNFTNFPMPEFLPANAVINENINEVFTEKISYNSSAKSAILIDAQTGRVLYSKNSEEKLPMASTTKIVTAITAIENCTNLDEKITIDPKAVGTFGTSIYLQPNEELSVRELLYGLMLRSGNDASVAIAYAIAGSEENFCEMMNQTATKIGATNSHFVNPHGLDEKEHYTTASDLAKITAYALENETFAEIVKTKTITICKDQENKRYLINKNKLLASLDGCIGVKTGFTDNAGRCLVSACERDGLRLVAVVFNCGPMFEESAEMFEKAFNEFKLVEILPSYHFVKSVPVENGEGDFVGLYTRGSFKIALSEKEESNLNVVFNAPESLDAPVKYDMEVGDVEIYYGNHLLFSEKIYTIEEVDSKLFKDKLKEILDNWNA